MARNVGDRVTEMMGTSDGTITSIHEPRRLTGSVRYGIEWDDGAFPGKMWPEYVLRPAVGARA
jgi:hypothetical protein